MTQIARRERRRVLPFPEAPEALGRCALTFHDDEDFDPTRELFTVEEDELNRAITVRVRLHVDFDALERGARLQGRDVDLVITSRDDEARHFRVLERWPSESVPDEYSATLTPGEFGNRGIDLVTALVVRKELRPRPDRAHRQGATVAQRSFRIVCSQSKGSFPIHWSDFAEREWPSEALWHVRWTAEDLDRPPEEVVEIHLNKRAEALVEVFRAGSAGAIGHVARFVRPLVAAEIMSEIALKALLYESETDADRGGFRSAVLRNLTSRTGRTEDELRTDARDNPGLLRAMVQHMFRLASTLDRHLLSELST